MLKNWLDVFGYLRMGLAYDEQAEDGVTKNVALSPPPPPPNTIHVGRDSFYVAWHLWSRTGRSTVFTLGWDCDHGIEWEIPQKGPVPRATFYEHLRYQYHEWGRLTLAEYGTCVVLDDVPIKEWLPPWCQETVEKSK